ncbi:MAG: tRNA (guanosine(37)-N1)-methyltransferase TrmD [Selenomonadaceae bacterium]|nr:tRNA (guanosine(37)-N1)-methyltransferase TrmD [Selenomonadaceae bacterium]
MRIDVITLFPEMFAGPFGESIIKRAVEHGILDIHFTNFRNFAFDKHRQVDDSPFGGGSGMVLKPEPLFRAVRYVKEETADCTNRRILLMDPSGVPFHQEKAKELASYEQLIFICGHYEGFDARITENLADEAISIGDYVLTGGELPAMVITDAVARMLPGVLGSEESAPTDSFYHGLLEFPQYTRPREFEGMQVPEILFSGDHGKIRKWRRQQSLRITQKNRPDLLERAELAKEDRAFLSSIISCGCADRQDRDGTQ